MPTVLRKYGIRFHFYGSDMSEPPHIHASADGHKAKVWLTEITVADSGGFNKRDLARMIEVSTEHRGELLEAWNEFSKRVS